MGLLADIQASLIDGGSLAHALLKMRVLAARLRGGDLEDWVRLEGEGYKDSDELPSYRKLRLIHLGHYSGPMGSEVINAQIPPAIVARVIGEDALDVSIRDSISGVERLARSGGSGNSGVEFAYGNYPLFLQGAMFPGHSLVQVKGVVSSSALEEIAVVVRSKLLDLTLQIEREIPEARHIETTSASIEGKRSQVSQIFNQTIHGNVSNVQNSGDHSTFNTTISQGNKRDVAEHLAQGGIDKSDADAFAEILASEKPTGTADPLGPKAKSWIAANIPKALSGVWKAGLPVATTLLTTAAEHYYGLK